MPAAPHDSPAGQSPHWRMPPHPSATGLQFAPTSAHVTAVLHGPPSVLNAPVEPPIPDDPEPVPLAPPTLVPALSVVPLVVPLALSSVLPHAAIAPATRKDETQKIRKKVPRMAE